MRKVLIGTAVLMSAVFFLMSWCMILQIARTRVKNTMPCHTTAPDGGKSPAKETASMERCCQAGILKAHEKYKADFQAIDYLPVAELPTADSILSSHRTDIELQPLHSPPTARRLAELSLLRI